MNQIKTNKNVDLLIEKIFLFGIKYYNFNYQFDKLLKEIELHKNEDIKEYIKKIKLNNDDYN